MKQCDELQTSIIASEIASYMMHDDDVLVTAMSQEPATPGNVTINMSRDFKPTLGRRFE
jgi:hypothetical protein